MQSLRSGIGEVLNRYASASRETFAGHEVGKLLRDELPQAVKRVLRGENHQVEGSAGRGRWAETPWVAVEDPLVTDTVQRGHYVVYLFRHDGSGVYLSLNQGTTEVRDRHGSRYIEILETRARDLLASLSRAALSDLARGRIALGSNGWLSRGYEAGNVVAKLYRRGSLPEDDELEKDLVRFLGLYRMTTEVVDERTEQDGPIVESTGGSEVERAALRWHQRADRNSRLVADAKRVHGCTCQVCGFNFERAYGRVGAGFIEAHHLTPFSELRGRPTALNPRADFAVVCSNCHRMLHRELPPLTLVELRTRLANA